MRVRRGRNGRNQAKRTHGGIGVGLPAVGAECVKEDSRRAREAAVAEGRRSRGSRDSGRGAVAMLSVEVKGGHGSGLVGRGTA